ncbi:MAG: NAD(+) diphosphatase [Oscillospiraceae bacterium]|nr:NAD(+) diphosphatase [Oscillospiraceae bacterium]
MIHELDSLQFRNEYINNIPDEKSRIICMSGASLLVRTDTEEIVFPSARDMYLTGKSPVYLFSVGEIKYFYSADEKLKDKSLFGYLSVSKQLRYMSPKHEVFAAFTAYHLINWYLNNRFCGRCGSSTVHSQAQRMLYCPQCKNEIYPKISPAVIVAVTNGDKLLMTRYADRDYNRQALVAGFTEIGETSEQTAAREVMEETGLKIKNIRYYKNQPWGMTGTLLTGFFAQLDSDDKITLDTSELSEAGWYSREEINAVNEDFSLTNEMIWAFKNAAEFTNK